MTQDVATLKAEIISALDLLPPESLRLLREFVTFLRARGKEPAPQARIVKLGGLWKGYTFTEEEITAARREDNCSPSPPQRTRRTPRVQEQP